jgi:lysophospholipid acyltransferase (LPLAT)-like uncharacterized protein
VAVASKWRVNFEKSWDKSAIGLPFSKILVLAGDPIYVEKGAETESIRLHLESCLNEINAKAYAEV